jgi:hypothetical protein
MSLSLPHKVITDHRDSTRNFEVLAPVVDQTTTTTSSLERKVASLQSTVAIGAWIAFTLSASLEAGGGYEPAARVEMNGTVVRFRGLPKVKAGKEVAGGATMFTLPAGQRPTKTVGMVATTVGGKIHYVQVATNGETTLGVGSLAAAEELWLDGMTFNLA